MPKYVDTDSLITMINELQRYREDLNEETLFIANTTDYCKAVLGEDEICKAYITRIDDLVFQLNAVQNFAYEVQCDLQTELNTVMNNIII